MKKICVIGHFGFGKNLLNGQTIKTKIIADELEKMYGCENIKLLDLAGGVKKIPYFLLIAPFILMNYQNIIIMPVENGLRFLTPLLNFFNHLFHRKIHYVVIGGWLREFIEPRKNIQKGIKKFHGIYVETKTMKASLEDLEINNVFVLPNFKRLNILKEEELIYSSETPLKLCTFSRVMKEKGIVDAINAVDYINKELGYTALSLDIYGQVWDKYQADFENLMKTFPDYIKYKGSVEASESVNILKNYFALLFPTYYEGEGFAGTLIDAYSAGLPVIATDWKYNSELVTHETGFIFQTGNQKDFINILKSIVKNPNLILSKKASCLTEANKYKIDKAIKILTNELD